jgi:amidase
VGIAALLALFMNGFRHEIDRLPTPELLERRMRAEARTSRLVPDWLARRALCARGPLTERLLRPIADCDVLMTPVLAKPPIRIGYFAARLESARPWRHRWPPIATAVSHTG